MFRSSKKKQNVLLTIVVVQVVQQHGRTREFGATQYPKHVLFKRTIAVNWRRTIRSRRKHTRHRRRPRRVTPSPKVESGVEVEAPRGYRSRPRHRKLHVNWRRTVCSMWTLEFGAVGRVLNWKKGWYVYSGRRVDSPCEVIEKCGL